MAELDRREKEYDALKAEKEKLFQEAQQAYGNQEFSTALSKLARLLALGRSVGDSSLFDLEIAYQDFYNRVFSEYDEINRAHAEGQRCLVEGNFTRIFEICARYS